MRWFALHPRLILLVMLAVDVFAARRVNHLAEPSGDPELAGWAILSGLSVVFGTVCILFPRLLGGMEGPAGRGAWLNPTPPAFVTGIGWVLMAVPLIVLLLLTLFGSPK